MFVSPFSQFVCPLLPTMCCHRDGWIFFGYWFQSCFDWVGASWHTKSYQTAAESSMIELVRLSLPTQALWSCPQNPNEGNFIDSGKSSEDFDAIMCVCVCVRKSCPFLNIMDNPRDPRSMRSLQVALQTFCALQNVCFLCTGNDFKDKGFLAGTDDQKLSDPLSNVIWCLI